MNKQKLYIKASRIKGQKLPYPAKQSQMIPLPEGDLSDYSPAGKLDDKVAVITGGDSGIGRSVAIAFAKEGANVAIVYNVNDADAEETRQRAEKAGRECLVIKEDVRSREACFRLVDQTVRKLGKLNCLVNNAAFQKTQARLEDIEEVDLRCTFETNIFGYFFMAQASLPHLKEGDTIISTFPVFTHPLQQLFPIVTIGYHEQVIFSQ